MEQDKPDIKPLIFLFAESYLENINLRFCLEDSGIDQMVTMVNLEHLEQELYHKPDIIIINQELDHPSAENVIKMIGENDPYCQIIFLIENEDRNDIVALLSSGSFDYVTKDEMFNSKITRIINSVSRWKLDL